MIKSAHSIGRCIIMKSNKTEENRPSIRETWKPSDGINWDTIQRMRFMNADAEIDPEDSYSRQWKKESND